MRLPLVSNCIELHNVCSSYSEKLRQSETYSEPCSASFIRLGRLRLALTECCSMEKQSQLVDPAWRWRGATDSSPQNQTPNRQWATQSLFILSVLVLPGRFVFVSRHLLKITSSRGKFSHFSTQIRYNSSRKNCIKQINPAMKGILSFDVRISQIESYLHLFTLYFRLFFTQITQIIMDDRKYY